MWSKRLSFLLLFSAIPCFADIDTAFDCVRATIDKIGLQDGYNDTTGEIIGIGNASECVSFGSTIRDVPLSRMVDRVRVAQSKALMSICKSIESEMSGGRQLGIQADGKLDRKIISKVLYLRAKGKPLGFRTIAKSWKIVGSEFQVSVAVAWSLRRERKVIDMLIAPKPVDEMGLEEWAKTIDFVEMLGDGTWTDKNGHACFVGIGAVEVKSETPMSLRKSMLVARANARRNLIGAFLENVSVDESFNDESRTDSKASGDDRIHLHAYSYSVSRKMSDIALPGTKQVYTSLSDRFSANGKRICYSVFSCSSVEASRIVLENMVNNGGVE